MTSRSVKSLCRICLQEGATCLIFDENNKQNSVYAKLRECFKVKIEDVEGYPRNICLTCYNTLETVHSFINKFKETHKILEGRFLSHKQESNDDNSEFETDNIAENEIDIKNIKPEPEIYLETLEDTEDIIELLQPLQETLTKNENLKKKIKKESFKTEKVLEERIIKNKYKNSNRTEKVATSILEGEFAWTGELWCLKTTQLKVPRNKGRSIRRDTRLKLPRKKKVQHPELCDICGGTYESKYKLKLHRNRSHFNNPMQCSLCTRICSSQLNLVKHMKRKHSDKDYTCATCGKTFAFKGELTNHISKVHIKKPKRQLKCKFCDKTYLTQKSIIIHERSVHTGERPAECTICSKGFFHEDYLKEHMRLHTGEVPFKCPVCGQGYAQRGNMKSHLRIHRISDLDAAALSRIKPNYLKLLKV